MLIEVMEPTIAEKAKAIALREKEMSLSDREWHHRLGAYGYSVRETEEGRMLTQIAKGVDLCILN